MTPPRSIFRWFLPVAIVALTFTTQAQRAPELVFDPTWPKDLPSNWKLGGVTGLALDRDENVWLYNRPNDLTNIELHAELDPPLAPCCVRAVDDRHAGSYTGAPVETRFLAACDATALSRSRRPSRDAHVARLH